MELIVKSLISDTILYVSYKEAMVSLIEHEEKRTSLIKKFLKAFGLRLDEIKFGRETLSGNFIHFLRKYDSTFFDVSFGLEEASSKLLNIENDDQALDLYGRLFQILDEIPISLLRFNIHQQLSAETDIDLFLESLNSNIPTGFKDMLKGSGVQYNLEIPKHNLKVYITLSSSILYDNAIFLSIEYQFLPYSYDFQTSSKIIKEYYGLALKELGLDMKNED